jgi:1,2-diacylglycerol 3-beta-galactosyltransferase
MGKKVLILMCDAGGGHRSVSSALAGALGHLFPGEYEIRLCDVVADGLPWPLNLMGRMYGPFANHFPRLWGLLWHFSNGRRRSRFLLWVTALVSGRRLKKVLASSKPDLVVSAHPMGHDIAARLLQELGCRAPLITVVTDLVTIHRWWLCRQVDLCLVPTEEVRTQALAAGLAPERVKVVGIPVDLKFVTQPGEPGELRKGLGLEQGVFTVLLMGGGEGVGMVFDVARAIARASLKVQLLVVAGRNEKLKKRLEEVNWEVPTRILGFTRNMPDLMHVADVMITKAGPSTMSEALACGLPLLITGSLRGQEEGNVEWAVGGGAGLFTPTPHEVVAALEDLVRPGNRATMDMSHRARQVARPLAALEAGALIDRLLERPL